MNLNNKINKATAITIPLVLFILFTLAFIILPKTSILITAYVVAVIGVIFFCLGNLYFISAKGGYPWVAAIPMTLWRYIITATLLSGVFIIGENFVPNFKLSPIVLIIGHVLVFAFFFVMLMLMHTGKEYVEEVDKKIAVKRQFIKELTNDLMSMKENTPDTVKKDVQTVIDAVRYSDPMSHESLTMLENDIQDNVIRLGQQTDPEQISLLCATLVRQLKDRNAKTKALK